MFEESRHNLVGGAVWVSVGLLLMFWLIPHHVEEDPDLLTPRERQVACIFPYVAGIDTVANTCAFLLHALTTRPDVGERVLPEIRTGFESTPTPGDLKTMVAFHGATMETLRFHPVSPFVARHAAKDFDFEGHRVAEGEDADRDAGQGRHVAEAKLLGVGEARS